MNSRSGLDIGLPGWRPDRWPVLHEDIHLVSVRADVGIGRRRALTLRAGRVIAGRNTLAYAAYSAAFTFGLAAPAPAESATPPTRPARRARIRCRSASLARTLPRTLGRVGASGGPNNRACNGRRQEAEPRPRAERGCCGASAHGSSVPFELGRTDHGGRLGQITGLQIDLLDRPAGTRFAPWTGNDTPPSGRPKTVGCAPRSRADRRGSREGLPRKRWCISYERETPRKPAGN